MSYEHLTKKQKFWLNFEIAIIFVWKLLVWVFVGILSLLVILLNYKEK